MRLLISLFLLFITTPAWATVYYIRDLGGTVYGTSAGTNVCNGQTNVVYSSGVSPNCALANPRYVLGYYTGGSNVTGPMAASDTMYIDGDSDKNPGSQAQYEMGYDDQTAGALTPGCSTGNGAYNCSPLPPPAGTSSTNETKIIGCAGYTGTTCNSSPTSGNFQPQLWGNEGMYDVMDLVNGNLDFENIEITQHSTCSGVLLTSGVNYSIFPAGCGGTDGSYPYGPSIAAAGWAQNGIYLEGTNVTTKNLWIHNISGSAVYFPGVLTNWNSTNDRFIAAGAALTNGGSMSFGGTNNMTNDVWAWGGCMEKYPLPDPSNVKDTTNYLNCADQNYAEDYGGYALGGGFMMQNDSSGACGNWNVNYSQFLFNLKTNIDFLHCNGTGTFNLYRSRSEGSDGEAFKASLLTVNIEESQLIGNAPVWKSSAFEALKAPAVSGSWDYYVCRGNAVSIFSATANSKINYVNDDVTGNCTALIETQNAEGVSCSGMGINAYNSKFIGGYGYDINEGVDLYYDGSVAGSCTSGVPLTLKYNGCYNAATYGSYGCSSGTSPVTSDPKVIAETNLGTISTWLGPTSYYSGTSLGDQLYLQSSSPLISAGTTSGVTYTNGSTNDYNDYAVTDSSPAVDIGGIQYGSTIATSTGITNGFCSISNQCASETCSSAGYCVGSCTSNGSSCSSGSNCCSLLCQSSLCVSCLSNNQSCSSGSQCCSGICTGSVCVNSLGSTIGIQSQLSGECILSGKTGI